MAAILAKRSAIHMERIMLHSDMDRFYCAVEEKFNPSLKIIPFAVCGDPAMRHSIVMSANNIARQYGVRAGLRYADARQLCPSLKYVTADMSKYLVETKAAREVYLKYTDKITPYGMDESWIDLGDRISWYEARQIAELIRLEIMYSLGLSTSIGVSYNLIFSKIGSDYNKPNEITVVTRDKFKDIIWPLDVEKLLFVGQVRKRILTAYGIRTIGDIANADPGHLATILRCKVGYDLWQFANGDDRNFKPESDKIGSIGNTITPPADLQTNDEVSAVIYMLASAVCARLQKHSLKARSVSISLRDNQFNKSSRQCTLEQSTDSTNRIFSHAFNLFKTHYHWNNPLRSIGIRATNLDNDIQLSLYEDKDCDTIDINISSQLKRLTERFGVLQVESAGGFEKMVI